MKKLSIYLIWTFLSSAILSGQYTESFNIASRGILSGPCGATANTCASFNFSGVTWNINGDLAGIDSEGFFTTGGNLVALDTDGNSCWISPIINTSAPGNASFTVTLSIPSGSTWDNNGPPGTDYADVSYAVNGGSFTTLSNITSCPGSGHTISWIGCTVVPGPLTFTPTVTGISGTSLEIRVCIETNASSDIGNLEEISVTGGVLPVTWLDVFAYHTTEGNMVEWSTANEVNNDFFDIEGSADGIHFEYTSSVNGAGNTNEINHYTYADRRPFPLLRYYRIKQVDFDGRYEYSRVVVVDRGKDISTEKIIYPNPANSGTIELMYTSAENQNITVTLYDMAGKVLANETKELEKGTNHIRCHVGDQRAGMYILKCSDDGGDSFHKVVMD